MRKRLISIVVLAATLPLGLGAADIALGFSISRGWGLSEFYDPVEQTLISNGRTFVETEEKQMGFCFHFSAVVPVIRRLAVSPEFSIHNGNKSYQFVEALGSGEANGDADITEDYSFWIRSGAVNIIYTVLQFESGWRVNLLSGITLNYFSSDSGARLNIDRYWGYRLGVGFDFRALDHFSFRVRATLNRSFDTPRLGYAAAEIGVYYIL